MDFSVGVNPIVSNGNGLTPLDWVSIGTSVLDAGTHIYDATVTNKTNQSIADQNMALQRETNLQNEKLMRESWLRDDTAVQRRIADLKAAGLSPLLAAGSAAGNSGAIQLSSPHNDYRRQNVFDDVSALSALSAVQSVKGQALDNKIKELGIRYYGMPDWLIGIQRVLGELPEDDTLRKYLQKAFDYLFPSDNGNTPSSTSEPTPWIKTTDYSRKTGMPIDNKWSLERLKEKGVDTTPPSLESHPKDFGITNQDLIQDGTYLIEQLRSDGKLTKQNVEMIANTLGKRYNRRKGDIFDWLMSLAGL